MEKLFLMHDIFQLSPLSGTFILLSYLIGSLPFGYIFFKLKKNKDIRGYGSGNIGATNVNRLLGRKFAILTFFLDTMKSFFCTYLGYKYFGMELAALSGFLSVIGHIFPLWLKFKGGKGVASFIGYILFISWPLTVLFIVIWTITVKAFKISSIGAIIGLLANIIFFKLLLFIQFKYGLFLNIPGQPLEFNFILLISFLIFFKHKGNVKNILK